MTAQEILGLNKDAHTLLCDMIIEQVANKQNVFTDFKARDGYLEYRFQDGTLIELAVIRDFNDNMKPVSVVVNHYLHSNNSYTRLFTDNFQLS